MTSRYNKLWLGIVLGLLAPLVVLFSYYKINFSFLRLDSFLFKMFMGHVLTPLLSLCVVVNLGIFYLFIRKDYYYSARGVLFSTFIYAIIVFIAKLTL